MPANASPLPGFACPVCSTALVAVSDDTTGNTGAMLRCPSDQTIYRIDGGIWRLLAPDQEPHCAAFLDHYQAVRRDEGWGTGDADYYRALPFVDTSDRHPEIWKIRAVSYRVLTRRIVAPAARASQALTILDLGAGNGWLAHRLATRGHTVAALDLSADPVDGLGAWPNYADTADAPPFVPLQASFDQLPFVDATAETGFDLAIFNGALHYADDIARPLREALRVLKPQGTVVILDSPFYDRRATGEAMVAERDETFRARYGGTHPSEAFLTRDRLASIGQTLGLRWQFIRPWYGWRWALRPWQNRLLGYRPPVRFLVATGTNC